MRSPVFPCAAARTSPARPAGLLCAALLLAGCGEHRSSPATRADGAPTGSGMPSPAARGSAVPVPSLPGGAAAAPTPTSRGDAGAAEPRAPAAAAPAGDRIYSRVRFLWIRPQPGPTQAWLGYLSLGDSVRVRGGDAAQALVASGIADGDRCRSWYAVEPRGYVCVGLDATLDAHDPLVIELGKTAADRRSPWPYQYGESIGTPVYASIPDDATQRRSEPDLAQHLERAARARAATSPEEIGRIDPTLVGVPLEPTGIEPPPPVTLDPLGRSLWSRVVRGSTVAYSRAFDHAGRSWLLTWDWGVVPRDRVRPYPSSSFAGVPLDGDHRLPIAFFRQKPRPKYRRSADGAVEPTGESWPRLGWVGLTDESVQSGGQRYLATQDQGLLCAEDDATVIASAKTLPPAIAARTTGRRTWVEVSVLGGWLIAYEAERPVFATLVSPGRGGIPFPGIPPLRTASTPLGQFTVTGKFLTATMVSSSEPTLVHTEVQYTQNFSGPHTLHGAYWHDDWGERKSGGCVNLSPFDAQRLFEWSEPTLPEGWHGVRWIPGEGDSTAVLVHR